MHECASFAGKGDTAKEQDVTDPSFEVGMIQDVSVVNGQDMYLVRWKGYGPEEDQWLSLADLENAPDVLAQWTNVEPS